MNAIEAAPQTSSNIVQYTPLQLRATIALCIMGGSLALVGLRWYYYQPEEGDETDANTEIKS